ncbi:hypothetical protein [Peredibacter starrii]|uniref:DUF1501 domain-containing protein n=1 Tax=Peredibacter starrii TaxID=28202 RepID=A0AAX4HSD7_9BACT|nr:hypothetical protein [Peredibacter starrii]WPU66117.1 hypothetical protein SOO65_05100 [Peredibacter starrii]
MSDKKKFELDRRTLLKNILLGTGVVSSAPFDMFLTNMMVNLLQSGTAHAAGEEAAFQDFKFISLVMAGGAPRYYWDLPVQPNGDDQIVSNPMVVNKFVNNGSTINATYATTKVGDYYMPHVWSGNIATTAGVVPMSQLGQNMMIMRGIDLQIDSHPIDRERQIAPVPGGISLTGLVADHATTPIPAVGRNGGGNFYRGEKGIAYVELAGTNPLTSALAPFSPLSSMKTINNGSVESAIDAALKRMSATSADKSKFLPSTFATRFNAKKMMMKSFGNLQLNYNNLVAKYRSLISRAFEAKDSLSLAGVDDMAIPGLGTSPYRVLEAEYLTSTDIRTMTDAMTGITNLAEGMAIAEFMVTQGLSSSVNIQADNFSNVLYQSVYNMTTKVTRTNVRGAHTMDVHFTGSHAGTILFSRYYRAVSACLYELIAQLKSVQVGYGQNLFDRTVLSVTSEFNRIPRTDGSGADHGWQGSNFTVLSGMIDNLTVVGNVKTNEGSRGTWGLAGPMEELNGREAIIGNASSTVSAMLEVKTPTPNDQAFAYKENGKVKLAIKSLKNVA